MKNLLALATMCTLALSYADFASAQEKCGLDIHTREILAGNPSLVPILEQYRKEAIQKANALELERGNSASKNTAPVSIPVVFHIVLNQSQIDAIGGIAGINERIVQNMNVINNDFNARNPDSSSIPAGFKPLRGNPQISFSLAHRKPDGTGTTGIEIKTVGATTVDFADHDFALKKTSFGGLDPWDNTKYLNIWICNIRTANLLGYAYSPYYASTFVQDPSQAGVVIDYGAFGVKPLFTTYYWHSGGTRGRTLTHELGHYFNLWHTWGNAAVGSGSCADDDDVDDTPKQFDATQQCPSSFPITDACTPGGNGIMYVNFMDYTGEDCIRMFTIKQSSRMQVEVSPGGASYGLTQNPQLFSWPTGVNTVEKENFFDIYPNPTAGKFNISFSSNNNKVTTINIINALGQTVHHINNTDNATGSIPVDIAGMPKGVYMVQCVLENGVVSRKVMLQ